MAGIVRNRWTRAAAFALSVLAPVSVSAHHSLAVYDRGVQKTISGTLKEFEWVNPHSWIHLVVQKDDGSTENWNFEGGGVGRLERAGWSKDMMKPGDGITVTYNPKRDGGVGGLFQGVITPDGQSYELVKLR